MTSQVTLGDIVEIAPGSVIDRKARTDSGVRVYGLDQLVNHTRELPPCIPESELPKRFTRLQAGDVVMALVGQTGRADLIDERWTGAVLDRECVALRLNDPAGEITPEWLYVWARSGHCRAQMDAHVTGVGVPRVPKKAVSSFTVPLASRERQRRAHAKVANLEAALDEAQQTTQLLEQLLSVETDLVVYESAPDDDNKDLAESDRAGSSRR